MQSLLPSPRVSVFHLNGSQGRLEEVLASPRFFFCQQAQPRCSQAPGGGLQTELSFIAKQILLHVFGTRAWKMGVCIPKRWWPWPATQPIPTHGAGVPRGSGASKLDLAQTCAWLGLDIVRPALWVASGVHNILEWINFGRGCMLSPCVLRSHY